MQKIAIGNITTGEYPLIAVPLTDKALSSDISVDEADIIEIRVDMFEDLSEKYVADVIQQVKEKFGKPVITTVRRYQEGGSQEIPDNKRESLYKAVVKVTDAIDIEIQSEIYNRMIKLARKNRKTTIGSFHDFYATPEPAILKKIIERGRSFKADIIKIAVMPNSADDLRTITAHTLRYYDEGIITIAMGALGTVSRIFLPMIGSLITFASVGVETAPGQLSLKEIKDYFSIYQTEGEYI